MKRKSVEKPVKTLKKAKTKQPLDEAVSIPRELETDSFKPEKLNSKKAILRPGLKNKNIKKAKKQENESDIDVPDNEEDEPEMEYCPEEDPAAKVGTMLAFQKRIIRPSLSPEELTKVEPPQTAKWNFPQMGSLHVSCKFNTEISEIDPASREFEASIEDRLLKKHVQNSGDFSEFSIEVMNVLLSYKDFLFTSLSSATENKLREAMCLHVTNHVLQLRFNMLANDRRLEELAKSGEDYDPDMFRDQCLTRPSVLILTPFRGTAFKIVTTILQLVEDVHSRVMKDQKKRFMEEFGSESENEWKGKPKDFREIMQGNLDDNFRIGISLSRKVMKLYTSFGNSDIILASPLGLFTKIKDSDSEQGNEDILASIQVVYLDQADVFFMQNWAHVNSIMKQVNRPPRKSHDPDIARLLEWVSDRQAAHFRQTVIVSRVNSPELSSVFTRFCSNVAGQLIQTPRDVTTPELTRVLVQMPHVFRRFPCNSASTHDDERFTFFKETVLPQLRDASDCRTLIVIPDYYDFIRVRNLFSSEEIGFKFVHEYLSHTQSNINRKTFRKDEFKFLLATERWFYFKRDSIPRVQRILFYQLPRFPHFYTEFCNMVGLECDSNDCNFSVSVLLSRLDTIRVVSVVGQSRGRTLLTSQQHTHMFVTGSQ